MSNTTLVAIVGTPAPQSPPANTGCAYQYKVSDKLYQCYTAEQWQQKQESDAHQVQVQSQQFKAYWANHWKQYAIDIPLGLVALVILWVIMGSVGDLIHKKRHPEDYDAYGFRKLDTWL